MTKAMLTLKERQILGTYIIAHCKIADGAQYAKWDEESGGSDTSVAERLREQVPRINMGHVRVMRQAFDLLLEPSRLVFVRRIEAHKLSELEALRDKLEALSAHVKECDVRLKDHETRLQAMEDGYTSPPKEADPANGGIRPKDAHLIERAADRAVAQTLDPLTEKVHPVKLWRRKGHRHASH